MKNNNRRNIVKAIIALLAILNMVLLFGFEYELFGFKWMDFHTRNHTSNGMSTQAAAEETSEMAMTAKTAENTAEKTDDKDDSTNAETAVEAATQENHLKKCIVISKSNARIRSGPGKEYERITSVPRNTVLTVLGEENGWVHVRTDDGIEGYISAELVEMTDEP